MFSFFGKRGGQPSFTPEARLVIERGPTEAAALGHAYVGCEHLAISLLRDGAVTDLLSRLGHDPAACLAQVCAQVPRGGPPLAVTVLPFTSRVKTTFELAIARATARGGSPNTIDLLVGVLEEGHNPGAYALSALGVTPARITELERGAHAEPPDRASSPSLSIHLDDASSQSIMEQIVTQIAEAAATGAVAPGTRLPTVRQLAETLDVAPGTVSRAYGELERRGVIITDGARGTFVAAIPRTQLAAEERAETLLGLLRPVAVAAYHLGAASDELRSALDRAMRGIFVDER